MVSRRAIRGPLALLAAITPTILLWFLTVGIVVSQGTARAEPSGPNPTKAPIGYLGLTDLLVNARTRTGGLGPVDMLVYADPNFAGTYTFYWLLPGLQLLLWLCLWAQGVPILTKVRPGERHEPSLRAVLTVSLAAGVFLAIPWLYACARVLFAPPH